MSPLPEVTAILSVLPDTTIGPKELPRRIQVTDGTLSLVAKGFGQLDKIKLSAGVYRATVESAKSPFEQMVFLAPGKNVSISYPVQTGDLLDSAARVPGSDAMHETMRGPLDQALTRPSIQQNAPAGANRTILQLDPVERR